MTLTLSGFLFMWLLLSAIAALLALMLDYWLAEPKRCHPLVGFGHWADRLQLWLNPHHYSQHSSRYSFQHFSQHSSQQESSVHEPSVSRSVLTSARSLLLGWLALLLAIGPLLYFVVMVLKLLHVYNPWLAMLVETLLLYLCLGGRSLQQHVLAVQQALQAGDISLARQRLGWIVSRETAELQPQEIAQATVETTLENSSDAIFASLFWFAIGGAPLALLHRWVNTLDAMWGYKNTQFLYFGRAAARLDDVMNYIPARFTALCFCVFSPRLVLAHKRRNCAWYCWQTQAQHCASPNAGVVMTAGAGALSCRLSEGAFYHGAWQQKSPMGYGKAATVHSINAALQLVQKSLYLYMAIWWLLGVAVSWVLMADGLYR